MGRKPRNGYITSYLLPKEEIGEFLGKPQKAIPEEYLDRRLTQLSLLDLSRMRDKHPHPYIYASWFGHNAQVFQLVSIDRESGEMVTLEEKRYYLLGELREVEQRLFDEAVVALKEGRATLLRMYAY